MKTSFEVIFGLLLFLSAAAATPSASAQSITQYSGQHFPFRPGFEGVARQACLDELDRVVQRLTDYGYPVIARQCRQASIGHGFTVNVQYDQPFTGRVERFEMTSSDEAACTAQLANIEDRLVRADFYPVSSFCKKGSYGEYQLILDFLPSKDFAKIRRLHSFQEFGAYNSGADCAQASQELVESFADLGVATIAGRCMAYRRGIDEAAPVYYQAQLALAIRSGQTLHHLKGQTFHQIEACEAEGTRVADQFRAASLPVAQVQCQSLQDSDGNHSFELRLNYLDRLLGSLRRFDGQTHDDRGDCELALRDAVHVLSQDPHRQVLHSYCKKTGGGLYGPEGFRFYIHYKQTYPSPLPPGPPESASLSAESAPEDCSTLNLKGVYRVQPLNSSSEARLLVEELYSRGSINYRMTLAGPGVPRNSTLFNGEIFPGHSVVSIAAQQDFGLCRYVAYNPIIHNGEAWVVLEKNPVGDLLVEFRVGESTRQLWLRRN